VPRRRAVRHVEADHGRLKARLRPTRGLKWLCSAREVEQLSGEEVGRARGAVELGLQLAVERAGPLVAKLTILTSGEACDNRN
jgi:hypothetical protein